MTNLVYNANVLTRAKGFSTKDGIHLHELSHADNVRVQVYGFTADQTIYVSLLHLLIVCLNCYCTQATLVSPVVV